MRIVNLLTLAFLTACSGGTVDETDDTEETDALDPRKDPSTWPTTVGPEERPATVTTPGNYDGTSELPLVLVLHGYGASGVVQDAYFQMSLRADARGFVVLAPDGTVDVSGRRFWNATDACCDFADTGVDDVAYLLGLIDEVEASIPIDPERIVVIGHSNGGFMSHRLACEASDRLAGIASLAGAGWSDPAACPATDPVSVLQIHGTDDTTIEYGGGSLLEPDITYPAAQDTVGDWAVRNGCGSPSAGGPFDYESNVAGDEATSQTWSDCDGGAEVALWTLDGAGHIPTFTQTFHDDVLDWLLARRR